MLNSKCCLAAISNCFLLLLEWLRKKGVHLQLRLGINGLLAVLLLYDVLFQSGLTISKYVQKRLRKCPSCARHEDTELLTV